MIGSPKHCWQLTVAQPQPRSSHPVKWWSQHSNPQDFEQRFFLQTRGQKANENGKITLPAMVQVPDTGSEVGRTLGMLSLTGTLQKVLWLDPLIIYFNILNMNSFEQTTFTFRNGAHRYHVHYCTTANYEKLKAHPYKGGPSGPKVISIYNLMQKRYSRVARLRGVFSVSSRP